MGVQSSHGVQWWPAAVACGAAVATGVLLYYMHRRRQPQPLLRDPQAKYHLPLIDKIVVSHDTRLFRFGLPSEGHTLGLPVGQHVYLSAKIDGKLVVRPYTPTSLDTDLGRMELLVKVYMRGVHPKFPEGGKMSQHLDSLAIGDTIDVRGPNGLLVYHGNGEFGIRPKKGAPARRVHASRLAMIAGGTGITPLFQIVRTVTENPADKTRMSLVFANQSEGDILLRDRLEHLNKTDDRLSVWYTLDRPPADWPYSKGFVSESLLSDRLPPPGADVLVLICGPPPMVDYACLPALDKLGYDRDRVFVF